MAKRGRKRQAKAVKVGTAEKVPEADEGVRENSRPEEKNGFSVKEEIGFSVGEEKAPDADDKAPESQEGVRENPPPEDKIGFSVKEFKAEELVATKKKKKRGRKANKKVEETKAVVEDDAERAPAKKRGRKCERKEEFVPTGSDFADDNGQEGGGVGSMKGRLRARGPVEYSFNWDLLEDQDDMGKPRRKVRRKRKKPGDKKLPTVEGRENCEQNMEDEGIPTRQRGDVVEGKAAADSNGGGVKNVGVKVYERRRNRRRNAEVVGVGDSELKGGQGNGGLDEENGILAGGRVLRKRAKSVVSVLEQEQRKINRLTKVRSFSFCKFVCFLVLIFWWFYCLLGIVLIFLDFPG